MSFTYALRTSLQRLCAVTGSAIVAAAFIVTPSTAHAAYSSTLCTGYDACAKAGYTHHGYKKSAKTMYWGMYGGHNCTNYVAYRMVQGGMRNVRPWSGDGNAYAWGTFNKSKTKTIPARGAVAWWAKNAKGGGSFGHVAYVEKVISADEIIISDDSWSGDFHWKRLVRSSDYWPTGFIYFNGLPAVGKPFADVVSTRGNSYYSPFAKEIGWMSRAKISTGYRQKDGYVLYRPTAAVSREAMAAFLYRAAGSPRFSPPSTSPFRDVSTRHPFYKEIAWMHKSGTSTGWSTGGGRYEYRPGATITREAMAAFLYRLAGEPRVATRQVFSDVRTSNNAFAPAISWMAQQRISTGTRQRNGSVVFKPTAPTDRDAMAAFLYRYKN